VAVAVGVAGGFVGVAVAVGVAGGFVGVAVAVGVAGGFVGVAVAVGVAGGFVGVAVAVRVTLPSPSSCRGISRSDSSLSFLPSAVRRVNSISSIDYSPPTPS